MSQLAVNTVDPLDATLAVLHRVPARSVLASSFGIEDMVLIDLIAGAELPIGIVTLDTGRLPGETYALIERTREHYGVAIDVYYPDAAQLEPWVRDHGINAFYRSVDERHACCDLRKVQPLKRALAGRSAWVTGLRRAQSAGRDAVAVEEFDPVHNLPKFNPLAAWSDDDVWNYVRTKRVPYNPLHDRGFPSIGCAPCTRAVEPGEDARAGRWWWERSGSQECGIHRRPLDVLPRIVAEAAR